MVGDATTSPQNNNTHTPHHAQLVRGNKGMIVVTFMSK